MAALCFLSILSFAALILPFVADSPIADTIVLGLVVFILCAIQHNQIMMFRPYQREKIVSSSSGRSSKSKSEGGKNSAGTNSKSSVNTASTSSVVGKSQHARVRSSVQSKSSLNGPSSGDSKVSSVNSAESDSSPGTIPEEGSNVEPSVPFQDIRKVATAMLSFKQEPVKRFAIFLFPFFSFLPPRSFFFGEI